MEAVDQGGTRSGGKRRPSPTAGDGKRKKRRFVWGDDLHAAFQTAIFDVGLRAATVHAVAGELPAVAPGEHLDAATVEAQLAAFRRQRPAAGGPVLNGAFPSPVAGVCHTGLIPWQPRQAAPARPLAEQRNWASVCVSWEPYLVANTQKNLEGASNMYQKQRSSPRYEYTRAC